MLPALSPAGAVTAEVCNVVSVNGMGSPQPPRWHGVVRKTGVVLVTH